MRRMLRLPGFGYSIIRFIDDIVILAPTRWQLRGAVKVSTRCWGRSVWRNIRTFLGYHFQSGRANRSQADAQQLHREDISA